MKIYWQLLKPYKKYLLLSPILVLAYVVCETIQPTLMAVIIDEGVIEQDLNVILKTGLYMVLFSFIAVCSNIANVYFSSKTGVGLATDLRTNILDKVQQFSFTEIDQLTPASLITRMTNDTTIIQQVVMMSMRLLLRAPLMILFSFFFVVRIAPELSWIIGVAIPILGVSIYILLSKGFPLFIKVQQKIDNLNATVRENLVNIRVVKSFVREDFEKNKFANSNIDLRKTVINATNIVISIMPVMQLVMNFSIVAILWFGGVEVINGNIQVGELIAFLNYITQILMALMLVSMTLMMFARASASSRRITEIFNTDTSLFEKDEYSSPNKNISIAKGEIEFRNVYFKYEQKAEDYVLKNINFHIHSGELIAIVGATGSAKTSLLQLIPRLYEINKGEILIDSFNINDYSIEQLRESVGMVLQKDELFSGTIFSNLRWGNPNASYEEIVEACKISEAHNFITSFPEGYETILGQGGVNLSGGQKQRISIARTLLKKPRILLLDDSMSAVDTATEKRIRENFRTFLTDTTILVVTQRISAMQAANRIVVLDDGHIEAIGTHSELLNTSEIYQEIYNSQQIVL